MSITPHIYRAIVVVQYFTCYTVHKHGVCDLLALRIMVHSPTLLYVQVVVLRRERHAWTSTMLRPPTRKLHPLRPVNILGHKVWPWESGPPREPKGRVRRGLHRFSVTDRILYVLSIPWFAASCVWLSLFCRLLSWGPHLITCFLPCYRSNFNTMEDHTCSGKPDQIV